MKLQDKTVIHRKDVRREAIKIFVLRKIVELTIFLVGVLYIYYGLYYEGIWFNNLIGEPSEGVNLVYLGGTLVNLILLILGIVVYHLIKWNWEVSIKKARDNLELKGGMKKRK